LDGLGKFIQESYRYDIQKLKRVDSLKSILKEKNIDQYDNYLRLYDEYYIFNYDSAFTYAKKMQEAASASNDSSRQTYALRVCSRKYLILYEPSASMTLTTKKKPNILL